jgi:glycosyltransferase involved in cell wall biosynthesis
MKIAYVTTYDSKNIRNWSGLGYYIGKTLKEQFNDITCVANLQEPYTSVQKGKRTIYNNIFNKKYLSERDPIIIKNYAKQINEKLCNKDIDLIFSPGTIPIAKLETIKPIVFWTDATFAGMVDFYSDFSNLCKESIINGNMMEKSALQRCKLAIYSSEWAAQTAIQSYGIDEAKVKVIPFGANINRDITDNDVKDLIENKPNDKCKLLFIGVDWTRKGGNIAVKVTEELNRSGLETELIIAGCQPSISEPLPSFVKVVGFINKNEIQNFISESHFLILPSRAEAYGLVLCEANAFGVPCITTNVGGIPTIIKDGFNGKKFSKNANIDEYCAYILDLFSDYSKYKRLALTSLAEYHSRLNWSVAGETLKNLLLDSISSSD